MKLEKMRNSFLEKGDVVTRVESLLVSDGKGVLVCKTTFTILGLTFLQHVNIAWGAAFLQGHYIKILVVKLVAIVFCLMKCHLHFENTTKYGWIYEKAGLNVCF